MELHRADHAIEVQPQAFGLNLDGHREVIDAPRQLAQVTLVSGKFHADGCEAGMLTLKSLMSLRGLREQPSQVRQAVLDTQAQDWRTGGVEAVGGRRRLLVEVKARAERALPQVHADESPHRRRQAGRSGVVADDGEFAIHQD
jgi:hypothetical protein